MSSSDWRDGEVGLFPELPSAVNEERTTGILPSQAIRELIAKGGIIGNRAITEEQIQQMLISNPRDFFAAAAAAAAAGSAAPDGPAQ